MAMQVERTCPSCDTARTFYRAASTTLHLGMKVKWRCPECRYGVVTVDGVLDSTADV